MFYIIAFWNFQLYTLDYFKHNIWHWYRCVIQSRLIPYFSRLVELMIPLGQQNLWHDMWMCLSLLQMLIWSAELSCCPRESSIKCCKLVNKYCEILFFVFEIINYLHDTKRIKNKEIYVGIINYNTFYPPPLQPILLYPV